MATRDDVIAALKSKGYKGPLPQQNVQPAAPQGMTNNPAIDSLIAQSLPKPKNIGNRIGDAISMIGGGKLSELDASNDYSKLYAQEAIKKQFEEPEYVVSYDQEGRPVFTTAPGKIKNAPFYASPLGQNYYGARTGQAQAQGQQAQTETEMMNTVLPQVRAAVSGQPGQAITPGTTVQAGPFNIPLNPKLTEEEAAAVSSVQTFKPQVEEIAKAVKGGIFGQENTGLAGNIKRTLRQVATDTGIPLLTSNDPKLQQVQGYLNSIRRYAFGEGGKNLTGTEKDIVYSLLNTAGKNDQQIIDDHQKAIQTIQAKSDIALGGRNAAIQGQQQTNNTNTNSVNDFSNMSDEELRRIAGVQ